jgi:malate dehydrogenase (oxaloacetate-decarboxylating)
VFHDDQHGTAIVVLAALTNALRYVHLPLPDAKIVVSGGGAAGSAIVQLLLAAGAVDVTVYDRPGLLHKDDESLTPSWRALAEKTNPRGLRGTLRDGLQGADVFIGVSAPNLLKPSWIEEMAPQRIVFALANPDPEVDIYEATQHATVIASGRSDYPNQINNVLAFPGVFRGLLDARATDVTTEMMISAAEAIASVVTDEQLNPNYIIPSVFHPDMSKTVAKAIVDCVPKAPSPTIPMTGA